MAAKEMYDYLQAATADYTTTTLTIKPSAIRETGQKNIEINTGDDESEERVAVSLQTIFYVTLSWRHKSESDAGTIFDFYNDQAKGAGEGRSFKWEHPTDGHTYVVRFDGFCVFDDTLMVCFS